MIDKLKNLIIILSPTKKLKYKQIINVTFSLDLIL